VHTDTFNRVALAVLSHSMKAWSFRRILVPEAAWQEQHVKRIEGLSYCVRLDTKASIIDNTLVVEQTHHSKSSMIFIDFRRVVLDRKTR